MPKPFFLEKYEKYISLSSAEFAQRMVKVYHLPSEFKYKQTNYFFGLSLDKLLFAAKM